jgi:DUF1680 family protein
MAKTFHGCDIRKIEVTDTLFGAYLGLVSKKIIPYQWEILNDRVAGAKKSYCLDNFRIAAGEKQGHHMGAVFGDTDAYKWLETVAYCCEYGNGDDFVSMADELIALIGQAQEPDGYLNTYYSISYPEGKWTNLAEGHELYSAGHLIEAAGAYHHATGRTALLEIATRFADLICRVFDPDGELRDGYPGHPEIELALVKLYYVTGRKDYLDMARHFVNVRGQYSNYLVEELERQGDRRIFPEFLDYDASYAQAHLPTSAQTTAEGHAVRAMYLYSAMADIAAECEDTDLRDACQRLWENTTKKRMYITGGIGSSAHLERFTADYDLPNDRMYAESCASVGLMMFGQRMAALTGQASYFDEVERALCNTVLGGIGATGEHYFYVNPLEVWPANCLPSTSMAHVKPVRQKWFDVACCPTNIARTLASLGQYIYAESETALYINLFITSKITTFLNHAEITVELDSTLIRDGKVRIVAHSQSPQTLYVRIPHYFENPRFSSFESVIEPDIKGGYAKLPVSGGREQAFCLKGDIRPAFLAANEKVRADAGRLALVMGPYVYCLEEMDNGENLASVFVRPDADISIGAPAQGIPGELPTLCFDGTRIVKSLEEEGALYGAPRFQMEPVRFTAIPYGLWNNRQAGEMAVWLKASLGE